MGWTNSHLHSFTFDDQLYGMQFDDFPEAELDETEYTVSAALRSGVRRFVYDLRVVRSPREHGTSGQGRRQRKCALSVVDVSSVPDRNDDNHKSVVLNRVDDAVVPHANPESRPATQGTRCRGPRVVRQEGDCSLDTWANVRVEFAECPDRGRAQFYPIEAHAKPRSALTCSQGMLGPSSAIAASKAATSSASSRASISSS